MFFSFFLSFLSSFCFASFFLSTHNCYWCIVCTHITRTCMIPLMSHLFGQSLSSTLNKKQQQQKQHDIDAIFPFFKHSEEYKNQAFYFMINSPKWTNKRTCAVDRRILSVKENKRSKNNEFFFFCSIPNSKMKTPNNTLAYDKEQQITKLNAMTTEVVLILIIIIIICSFLEWKRRTEEQM